MQEFQMIVRNNNYLWTGLSSVSYGKGSKTYLGLVTSSHSERKSEFQLYTKFCLKSVTYIFYHNLKILCIGSSCLIQ